MTKEDFIKKYINIGYGKMGRDAQFANWNDLELQMDEDLVSVIDNYKHDSPVKTKVFVDTDDFEEWACKAFNMNPKEYKEKIWESEKGLLYFIEGSNRVTFTQEDELSNKELNRIVQKFFSYYPEFKGKLSLICLI